MNWYNLAHAAYDKYREAMGNGPATWDSLNVIEKTAWIASVRGAAGRSRRVSATQLGLLRISVMLMGFVVIDSVIARRTWGVAWICAFGIELLRALSARRSPTDPPKPSGERR